ncbi:MAG TPA: HPP family protein [Microbacteriaceae bacterium]|nr:HPP family protein [Microbacteriaceae bacterium]
MAERMTPQRRQMLVAIVMGAIVGGVLAWLAGFWMWFPAGLAVGLATGAIMKPPSA